MLHLATWLCLSFKHDNDKAMQVLENITVAAESGALNDGGVAVLPLKASAISPHGSRPQLVPDTPPPKPEANTTIAEGDSPAAVPPPLPPKNKELQMQKVKQKRRSVAWTA